MLVKLKQLLYYNNIDNKNKGDVSMKEEIKKRCRKEWNKYIRNYFIKSKCEECGCEHDLHLHHVIEFKDIFDEAWNLFEMEKDTAKKEEVFCTYVLGVQLKSEMMTLCNECHLKRHFGENRQGVRHELTMKQRDKLFIAFLCSQIGRKNFKMSCSEMVKLITNESLTRRERERMRILTQNKKYSYDEYQEMFNSVNFENLKNEKLINIYRKYKKDFYYILEIYYILFEKGKIHQTILLDNCEFADCTFYSRKIENIMLEFDDVFKVETYTDENNQTYKLYSLVPENL